MPTIHISPEVLALAVAIAVGVTRELLAYRDRRQRARGELRTRGEDL